MDLFFSRILIELSAAREFRSRTQDLEDHFVSLQCGRHFTLWQRINAVRYTTQLLNVPHNGIGAFSCLSILLGFLIWLVAFLCMQKSTFVAVTAVFFRCLRWIGASVLEVLLARLLDLLSGGTASSRSSACRNTFSLLCFSLIVVKEDGMRVVTVVTAFVSSDSEGIRVHSVLVMRDAGNCTRPLVSSGAGTQASISTSSGHFVQ